MNSTRAGNESCHHRSQKANGSAHPHGVTPYLKRPGRVSDKAGQNVTSISASTSEP
jgi:hypothetical protein